MNQPTALTTALNRIQTRALIVGAVALGLCVLGGLASKAQFFQSYLFGFLFWLGIALGSLALLALHHLVGGAWGFVIQRALESSARTLPLMALLFVPFFWGMEELYIWARPEAVAQDALLQHKRVYLNVPFFWMRTAGYFALWMLLAYLFNKWSRAQDRQPDPKIMKRIRVTSGPTLVIYVLTMTFASFDWSMSLDPHWFSTIYGILFVVGQGLATLAFAVIALRALAHYEPLSGVVDRQHYHDLGNLMLAFVMLWAYISFSQFLIIWSGNLPEEIPWYLHRLHGGWEWLAAALLLFHFALPFVLLLSRGTKRRAAVLAKVSLAMLFMRLVDIFWIVAPSFHPEKLAVHWMDLLAPIGIGGLWLAAFAWQLKGRALLPVNDPRLEQALQHE